MVKKTLVIGASLNNDRYSNIAINKLSKFNIEVEAIGFKSGNINSVLVKTELINIDKIHTITLYLNKAKQKKFYDYMISLNPKRVIFNPGTENPEIYKILDENSIEYLEACTLVLLSTNQY